MYMKGILLAGVSLMFVAFAQAQSLGEAFDFSNSNIQGTARSAGFGNALGSVGGDMASFAVNPAGIGVYRSSEISVTPSLKINGTMSDYAGTKTSDNASVMNINHFGVVLNRAPRGKRAARSPWKSVSFAFGMNKTGDFNRDFTYKGKNTTSSATQAMESDANLNPGNDTIPGTVGFLGWQGYLLNLDGNGKYRSVVPFQGGIDQQKQVRTRGGINEYEMTFGGNYRERWLLGCTIGLPTLNYSYTSNYSETIDPSNTSNPDNFTSFNYGKAITVTGNGINVKVGAIYIVSDNLRIGASLHSPTYYNLTETFSPQLSSTVGGTATYFNTDDFPIGSQFDYHLTTPWKGIVSGTWLFGAKGFVTADMEYVDYSSMHFTFPDGYDDLSGMPFQQEEAAMNQSVKDTYKGAVNIRLGGEMKIRNVFMVRAGVGYYGNAYQAGSINSQRTDLSLGLGWHFGHFFTDLAYVHSMYKATEQPYSIDYSGVITSSSPAVIPQAQINYQLNSLVWTAGLKFR